MATDRPPRIVCLDVLRSLAILLVMMHHSRNFDGAPGWYTWFGLRGYIGVDIFFVLSGWLIGGQLLRAWRAHGRIDCTRFWLRRWLRTLPVYYVMLVFFIATNDTSWPVAGSMMLFLQNYIAPEEWLITWSLCIEEHFYLLLPLLIMVILRLRPRPGYIALIGTALILVSPVLRLLEYPDLTQMSYKGYLGQLYSPSHLRMEGLFIGVAAAAAREWNAPIWKAVCCRPNTYLVLGVVLFVSATWNPIWVGTSSSPLHRLEFYSVVPQFLLVSISTAMMIMGGVAQRRRTGGVFGRCCVWISEHAYTLYLTHMIAFKWVKSVQDDRVLGFTAALMFGVTLALLFAVILRRFVELPGLRLRDRIMSQPSVRLSRERPSGAHGSTRFGAHPCAQL